MSRITRLLLGGLALAASPAAAAAQFNPVIGPANPLYNPIPFNPYSRLYQPPAWQLANMRSVYDFQFSLGVTTQAGAVFPVGPRFNGYTLGGGNPSPFGSNYFNGSFFVGMTSPSTRAPQAFYPYWGLSPRYPYGSGSMSAGYMVGGALPNDAFAVAQRELQKAQREAGIAALTRSPEAVKDAIYGQWAYEKLGVLGLPALKGGQNQPEELIKALGVTQERDAASGDVLNHVLVAVVAAEQKGAKGPSAFVPPQVMADVRFAGNPEADAANLIRQAGRLPFPSAFDDPKLKDIREAIEKDFAAVADPLLRGKPADPARLLKLSNTLKAAQEAATPVIRNLPFEDATAARRFLNRFENAVKAMRATSATALVNPAWATEGASVADLVKYMTRHKVLFAAAPAGGEGSYLALHKGLAAYLFALTQPKK